MEPCWLSLGLALSLTTGLLVTDASGNPYRGITTSNVFRLRPAQRQEGFPPPAPLPQVRPTGVTTILEDKRALLRVSYPARPPEPAREVSCILTVGQREGPIEVLAIDEKAGSIKINNSGTVMVLTLAGDSPRPHGRPPAVPPLVPIQPNVSRE